MGISYEERARQEAQLQAQAEADAALMDARHHEMRQLEVSHQVLVSIRRSRFTFPLFCLHAA